MPTSGKHIDPAALTRFAQTKLPRALMLEVGRHVFACSLCRRRLRTEIRGGAEILARLQQKGWQIDPDYDHMFERLEESLSERVCDAEEDERSAPALFAMLSGLPAAEQKTLVFKDLLFHSPKLVELLLETCRSTWIEDPSRAEAVAELALAISGRLSDSYSPGLANDLSARAWAHIGNVRRIRFSLREAEAAFAAAEICLGSGSGDPLERALVLDLKVSFLRATRRLDAALTTMDEVLRIYRRTKETHLEGRALVSKGLLHIYRAEPGEAIPLFEHALPMLDLGREPQVLLQLKNNVVRALVDLFRYQEASARITELQRMSREIGTWADRARCFWLEASIDAGLGHLRDAEVKLRTLRDEYVCRGIGYDVALVSLELAGLLLSEGRVDEVKLVASEMHVIFGSRELHNEALAALMLFQRAAERETATLQMVKSIIDYLKRAHGNPDVRFESNASEGAAVQNFFSVPT